MRNFMLFLFTFFSGNYLFVFAQEAECTCGEFIEGPCTSNCTQINTRECTDGSDLTCEEMGMASSQVVDCDFGDCENNLEPSTQLPQNTEPPVNPTVQAPIDCSCTDFTPGECSVTCGDGLQVNTRECTEGIDGGQTCEELDLSETEEISCNLEECPTTTEPTPTATPIDCICTDFTPGECSVTCGDGLQINTRECTEGSNGGKTCEELDLSETEEVPCNSEDCPTTTTEPTPTSTPIDCSCTDFTPGECSVTCGDGLQINTRECTEGSNGGKTCEELDLSDTEEVPCNAEDCPTTTTEPTPTSTPNDCSCTDFTPGECSVTCGDGLQINTRECTEGSNGGKTCEELDLSETEEVPCNSEDCPTSTAEPTPTSTPIDCSCTDFTPGECSVTCGDGLQVNTRECTEGSNGGKTCEELDLSETEEVSCNLEDCSTTTTTTSEPTPTATPIDCSCTDFTPGECSVTCGDGLQVNTRECTEGSNGGKTCEELDLSETEEVPCNSEDCPETPTDCTCEEFIDGTCSTTCGEGTQVNTRECTEGNGLGKPCSEFNTTETVTCKLGECPQDCICGDFTQGECSVTCGFGIQVNTRECTEGTNGGATCSELGLEETVEVSCQAEDCPTDCSCDEFVAGPCSTTCGSGTQINTRNCTEATNGGATCESLGLNTTETESCNLGDCVADCTCTEYVPGICSSTCGPGTRTDTRQCTGNTCDEMNTTQTVPCNLGDCSTDCWCTDWVNITECSSCQDRNVTEQEQLIQERNCTEATNGGKFCVDLGLTEESRVFSCSAINNCTVDGCSRCGDWFKGSECSVSCGAGFIYYNRDCPDDIDESVCGTQLNLTCTPDGPCDPSVPADTSSSGLSTGAIAGISAAIGALIVIIALILFFVIRKTRHQRAATHEKDLPPIGGDIEIAKKVAGWRHELRNLPSIPVQPDVEAIPAPPTFVETDPDYFAPGFKSNGELDLHMGDEPTYAENESHYMPFEGTYLN